MKQYLGSKKYSVSTDLDNGLEDGGAGARVKEKDFMLRKGKAPGLIKRRHRGNSVKNLITVNQRYHYNAKPFIWSYFI